MARGNCEPARKKARLTFGASYVRVLVGDEEQCFAIPKTLLCGRSTFFKAACADRWSSDKAPSISLPEDDADIFDIYVYILHNDVVDVGGKKQLQDEPKEDHKKVQFPLAKCWVLADKLGDIVTANILIDSLRAGYLESKTYATPDLVALVGNSTVTQAPLRTLIIDYYVHWTDSGIIQDLIDYESVPRAILGEMLKQKTYLECENDKAIIGEIYRLGFTRWPACRYHQHDDAHPKCKVPSGGPRGAGK